MDSGLLAPLGPGMTGWKNKIVLAMRLHPSFANHDAHESLAPQKGGGAPIGASNHGRTTRANVAIRKRFRRGGGPYREPPAFRRSAAALARANASAVGSAPVPAFPET
jgi:integrase